MSDDGSKTVAHGGQGRRGASSIFTTEDLSGQEVAGCQLLRKIGQGAMGAVYLAEQPTLRRTVAVKVLDPKFSRDITYIERFEREAQAAARLTHFNIVRVFDYGREEDVYYIVNEYVDGGDVQTLIEAEGVIDPPLALNIVRQACEGLAAAEEFSVVHRDIKPDNLMLTSDRAVKIADFGLAKVVEDDATVTQSGMIVGTPFYMSPEQAKGLHLDYRSDMYSLGVTFFHMVTGQIPFDADSVIGVLLKQISAERPDASAVNPSLPGAIGQVIMRMMARDVEDRYPSFGDLTQVLGRLQDQLERGGDEAALKRAVERTDRSERYKWLRSTQILHLAERKVTAGARDKMVSMLKNDAGVFVETAQTYNENSIVELHFSVPGRDTAFQAIGVVRWLGQQSDRQGVGVTFLKVSPLLAAAPERPTERGRRRRRTPSTVSAPPPQVPLNAVEAIRLLTKSPLHCRLLRYHYANSGQSVTVPQIASALGVGTRMLNSILAAFEQAGLLKSGGKDAYALVWPEEQSLQREIVAWVTKYGLL